MLENGDSTGHHHDLRSLYSRARTSTTACASSHRDMNPRDSRTEPSGSRSVPFSLQGARQRSGRRNVAKHSRASASAAVGPAQPRARLSTVAHCQSLKSPLALAARAVTSSSRTPAQGSGELRGQLALPEMQLAAHAPRRVRKQRVGTY